MTYRKVGGLHHLMFRWFGFSWYWRRSKPKINLNPKPLLITYYGGCDV
jgi:hypothetical protein